MDTAQEEIAARVRVGYLAETDLLRQLRERKRLRKAHVARWVGVNPSQVSRWETNMQLPKPAHCLALLELLDD